MCKGKKSNSCPICKCRCALGPFKNEDRPYLSAAFQDYMSKREERRFVLEDYKYEFDDCVQNALRNGARDLCEANEDVTWDSVQGAASLYIN